jgi:membrane-associated protease RseP (regulator of RpoE activity)
MSARSHAKVCASAAAACLFVLLLAPGVVAGQGSRDPATIPSPTGMLYGGMDLELWFDGSYRVVNYPTIIRLDSGSVAARAGFRLGDVLLSVNGRDMREARPFRLQGGEMHWVVRIRRGAEEKELVMEIPSSMRSPSPSPTAPPR